MYCKISSLMMSIVTDFWCISILLQDLLNVFEQLRSSSVDGTVRVAKSSVLMLCLNFNDCCLNLIFFALIKSHKTRPLWDVFKSYRATSKSNKALLKIWFLSDWERCSIEMKCYSHVTIYKIAKLVYLHDIFSK